MITARHIKFCFLFLIGFYAASLAVYLFYHHGIALIPSVGTEKNNRISVFAAESPQYLDQNVADHLFDNVKILCMIMTNPANHKTKAIHIKNSWGRRCNKLLFITTATDPDLDTIGLPLNESRQALRKKTKGSFLYAFEHHLDEFEWFMKADDDK
jgi:glycoprotein-N-acetylgalactosamine 3-beta-galactosyltransferase